MAEQAQSIEQRLGAILNPTPPAPEKAPVAAPAPTQPEPQPEPEPSSAGAVEGDEVAEPEASAPEWFPERLEDIAEAGGWNVADLYKVKIKVNDPSGKPVEVSLGEWKDAYQQSSQLDAVRRAEREAHERAETARKQALERISQQAVEVQALTQAAEQRLLAKYQSVNWDQLRALDPAEWAAKRSELVEEYNQLTAIKQNAAQAAQQQWQQSMAQQADSYQQYLREQASEVARLMPEFAVPEKVPELQKATIGWMKQKGFSDFEVGMVSHSARLVKMVRDQMILSNADTEAKKVVTSPKKFLKPGAAAQRGSREAEDYKKARSMLKRNPNSTDAAAAVLKKFLGG